MNEGHLELLVSPAWHNYLETELLPWFLEQAVLDGELLEIGPGPGLMTELLCRHVPSLVAVEVDPALAGALAERLAGPGVEVRCADASATGLAGGRFATATCATMLHHVPSVEGQDALFVEAHRLLRPGGRLVGVDSVDDPELRAFHADDVFVPVDPLTLGFRLEAAGFTAVAVESWTATTRTGPKVRFVATKPA
jgi:SAM-dependent methyltransferase